MPIEKKMPPPNGGGYSRRRRDAIVAAVVVVVFVLLIGSGLSSCVRKWFWNYEGPWNGTVVDAATGKPIEGAQVKVSASYSGFMMGQSCGAKGEFGQTDIDGRFHMNALHKFAPTEHYALYFTVYKKGYVTFSTMGSVGNTYRVDYEKFFKQKTLEIRLVKWDDAKLTMKDHVKNMDITGCWGGGGPQYDHTKLLQEQTFCSEAREEMILACMISEKYTKEHCEEIIASRP